MRLLCNQQSLDAGEALILSKVLDGLQYLCRIWQERVRQRLWPHGNPLAGLLSSLTVLWGFLGAEVALSSPSCSPDGAFSYASLGHPKYGPRRRSLGTFGRAVVVGNARAVGAAFYLFLLPNCVSRKIEANRENTKMHVIYFCT